jgi:hypothetical protein
VLGLSRYHWFIIGIVAVFTVFAVYLMIVTVKLAVARANFFAQHPELLPPKRNRR